MAEPIPGPATKAVREALGLSQEAWARRLGVLRVATISRWENGHTNPERRFWRKIRNQAGEVEIAI
jgi:DNA-binding transcriptional regulator YiaG